MGSPIPSPSRVRSVGVELGGGLDEGTPPQLAGVVRVGRGHTCSLLPVDQQSVRVRGVPCVLPANSPSTGFLAQVGWMDGRMDSGAALVTCALSGAGASWPGASLGDLTCRLVHLWASARSTAVSNLGL